MISSGCGHLAIGVEVVILGADADIARGQDEVRLIHAIDHIHQAHVVRFELEWVDVDLDLAIAAAKGLRHRRAGDVRDLIAHLELRKVFQLRLVQPFAFERDQTDRLARCRHAEHDGRQCAAGRRRRSAMARLEMLLSAAFASVPGRK